jgi:hypothetical protein
VLKDAGRTCYHRIIAAANVLVGFAFAILQLRDLVRTRQTDLVLRSHSMFGSREFQEAWVETMRMEFSDYQDYLKKYGATSEKPSFAAVNMVASFFEDMGILLHRKLVDIALIDDLFSSDIIITWRKLYPIVQGWRKQFNRPQISEWFEYLHNEIQKREQKLNRVRQ